MRRLGYVPALDGLRGLAILLVIGGHYLGLTGGPLGVDLFFVLSGFLITTLLLEEQATRGTIGLRGFYARRVRRLAPALVVTVALYLVLATLLGRGEPLAVIAEGGLYTGNVAEAFFHTSAFASSGLAHLWSLAEEEQFYLLWPTILVLLVRSRQPARWVGLLLVALVAYRIGLAAGGASHVRLYFAPDTHADGLVAGALFAFLRQRGLSVGESAAKLGLGLLALCLVARPLLLHSAQGGTLWDAYGLPVTEFAAVLLVAAAVSPTPFARALAGSRLVGLGRISYGLYLYHFMILWLLDPSAADALPAGGGVALLAIGALVISIAVAAVSYRWVEEPFRRRRAKAAGLEPGPVMKTAARRLDATA